MTPRKTVAIAVSVVMLAAVVAGLFVAGSPSQERARQYDQRRVSDLQTAANAIDQYWTRTKKLPESLEELTGKREYYVSSILDPRTGDPYGYRATGEKTYELCATFELEDVADEALAKPRSPYPYPEGTDFWRHGAGRVCFSFEAQTIPGLVPTL